MLLKIGKLQETNKNLEHELHMIKNDKLNEKQNKANNIDKKFNILLNPKILEINKLKRGLKKDILDYRNFIKSKIVAFNPINQKIVQNLQNNINKINSNYKAKLYGSRATNLCLMWSDIDIVINYENPKKIENASETWEEDPSEEERIDDNFLDKLNKELNNDISFVENIKYLNKAKVPIIKIKTTKEYNHTMVDITLKTKDHFGLKCVKLIKNYLEKYEALEALIFPLKTILKVGELNDPYNGGLSSYALILMIVYFLENQKKLNKNIGIDNIGHLFYDFLFFYGGRKDTNYIDFNNKNKNKNLISNNCLIYILDPLNSNNNVGKASFKFIEVKIIFLLALQIINEPCYCQCHYLEKKDDDNKYNINDDNIEHNYLNKIFFGLKRGKANSIMTENN